MGEDMPATCELLRWAANNFDDSCRSIGVDPDDDEQVLSAAAAGLVQMVWRNDSETENIHCAGRGLDDLVMFAESTDLHHHALDVMYGAKSLLQFEEHLLDRKRPWGGTDKTLAQMGRGHLREFDKQIRRNINLALALTEHTCIYDVNDDLPSTLVVYILADTPLSTSRPHNDHFGLPGWEVVVQRIGILLADPNHPNWPQTGSDYGAHAIATMPAGTTITELQDTLRRQPSQLPADVLDWVSNTFFWCAGPASNSLWWDGIKSTKTD
ncbi:hypothetical protein OG874_43960 [Nocardia sp. NBC_00565]|uniref:hypothetical protein n=1 Tax=Nocardia sp. NBC_00565 TaxID=2975993 RepID=UPI002E7FEB90|nr:hypothetical protein [Nocardia sp. NBC_00565]WUC03523.1 hypothetical protein OG874_43960 [Nocardia sp. NBC_00565]